MCQFLPCLGTDICYNFHSFLVTSEWQGIYRATLFVTHYDIRDNTYSVNTTLYSYQRCRQPHIFPPNSWELDHNFLFKNLLLSNQLLDTRLFVCIDQNFVYTYWYLYESGISIRYSINMVPILIPNTRYIMSEYTWYRYGSHTNT